MRGKYAAQQDRQFAAAPLAAEDGGYQNGQRRGTASVQKARAGEAAGTQKQREAEAGGEVAGMVRIEW